MSQLSRRTDRALSKSTGRVGNRTYPIVAFGPAAVVDYARRERDMARSLRGTVADTHDAAAFGGKITAYNRVISWATCWTPERGLDALIAGCVRSDGTPKQVILDEADAAAVAVSLGMSHYFCPMCDAFHVGNNRSLDSYRQVLAEREIEKVDE